MWNLFESLGYVTRDQVRSFVFCMVFYAGEQYRKRIAEKYHHLLVKWSGVLESDEDARENSRRCVRILWRFCKKKKLKQEESFIA